ncbi:MAG: hypothetical protein V9G24_18590 [Rhodoblastus sp.]
MARETSGARPGSACANSASRTSGAMRIASAKALRRPAASRAGSSAIGEFVGARRIVRHIRARPGLDAVERIGDVLFAGAQEVVETLHDHIGRAVDLGHPLEGPVGQESVVAPAPCGRRRNDERRQ